VVHAKIRLVVPNPNELEREGSVCVECGRKQAADERAWRAYLTDDEDEPAEAVLYCRHALSAGSAPRTMLRVLNAPIGSAAVNGAIVAVLVGLVALLTWTSLAMGSSATLC
jgi:hypothetical protein